MTQVRINVRTLVNASKIRRETRDGREVIIVPSATLPDNVVMKGAGGPGEAVMYPADEIEKAYRGLEGAPAPLGHPMVNGRYVSARSPEGLARSYVGGHNENVRRENGRVWLDKVIDVQVANQSERGRALLAAIDKQEPIHTSTGLLATTELVNAADHKYVARNMQFDHDAILLNEVGAATPEQGVGMFVNSAGEEIPVVNNTLDGTELPGDEIMLRDKLKSLIEDVIRGEPKPEPVVNTEATDVDKEQFDALSAKVDALVNAMAKADEKADAHAGITAEQVAEIVANALKPITDAAEAKAEAEKTALVEKIVNAKLLDKETADATPLATLTVLANSIVATPKTAFRVNAAFNPTDKGEALLPKE